MWPGVQVYSLQHHGYEREDERDNGRDTGALHGEVNQTHGGGEQDGGEHCYAREAGVHMKPGEEHLGEPLEGDERLPEHRVREDVDVRDPARLEDVGPDTNVAARIPVGGKQSRPPNERREGVRGGEKQPPQRGEKPPYDPVGSPLHA